MDFQSIEEQQDISALNVAELDAADIKEVGEETEAQSVRFSTSDNRYDDPVEAVPVITIEELLTVRSSDSFNVRVAKEVINELLSRQNCSHTKYTVARSTRSGDRSAPSLADFSADVMLCGKRSLPQYQYQIFCWAVDNCFERWNRVPEGVRTNILKSVGRLLVKRGIFSYERGTKPYWHEGFQQHGRASAQPQH